MLRDLEQLWQSLLLEEARARFPKLLKDGTNPGRQVAAHVVKMSDGLTRSRKMAGKAYLDEPGPALAYLLYYMPVNIRKLSHLLEIALRAWSLSEVAPTSTQLPPEPIPQSSQPSLLPFTLPFRSDCPPLTVVDLGCGPGTGLLALLQALGECTLTAKVVDSACEMSKYAAAIPSADKVVCREALAGIPGGIAGGIRYIGVDHSKGALRALESLHRRLSCLDLPEVELTPLRQPLRLPASLPVDGADFVILSNVVNELYDIGGIGGHARASEVPVVLEYLRPGGVMIVLEPASIESARGLCQLRDALLDCPRLEILSPCTHKSPCPLNADRPPARQWCHQELAWRPPTLIQQVDTLTGLTKHRLRYSHLIIRKRGAPIVPQVPEKDAMDGHREKGSPRSAYRALSPALKAKGRLSLHLCGAEGFVEALALKKNMSSKLRMLKQICRGDRVIIEGGELQGRILRLGSEAEIELPGRSALEQA